MLAAFDVLVFTKAAGFVHDSIDEGVAAIQALGAANDFTVTATDDATQFNDANLAQYEAVVFLLTTGDVLDATQQTAFENYIRAGGGFAGVHSAADTEASWTWYGQLLGGARYNGTHSDVLTATVEVADHVHASTAGLPDYWEVADEWFNYTVNPRGTVQVLATVDEVTYVGGTMGFDHPISWYHYFDGGRSWYTGLGHTESGYSDALFLDHLLGGIQFAAGFAPADRGASVNANWQKVELANVATDGLSNPTAMAIAPSGEVYLVEMGGAVKIYDPTTDILSTAGTVPVFMHGEDGMLAIALDANFAENGWVYLYFSPAALNSGNRLSRFTITNGVLDLNSEIELLTVMTDRVTSANDNVHSGGSLVLGPDGLLYLSTGDDTNPFQSGGYAPIDERAGRETFDAQRSSSNTNDFRGKILRIRPEADGTYSIPEGNLFPSDGSAGLPEIYTMGHRNPYRLSIDPATGWLYWGEVGPDAGSDDLVMPPLRGPRGYDEINQAREAGNFGWPYFIADNKAYYEYDFATSTSGAAFDPNAVVNNSPNNTGETNLPSAQPALIWYPNATSTDFPELGSGSRTAMAGPFYQFDPLLDSAIKLPEYLEGAMIMYDWSRDRFWEVRLDESGAVLKINRIFNSLTFSSPIEAELGPDGALYVIEWGTPKFNRNNTNAKLVRVQFVGNLPTLLGDYNKDGDVNAADYTVFRNALGATGLTPFSGADGTGDGKVTMDDYDVWKLHYGDTLPMAGAGAGEEIVGLGAGEETVSSVVAPQIATALGPMTETASEVGDATAFGPSSWFGVFAARDLMDGGAGMAKKLCAEKPVAKTPARDQALMELFHSPFGPRRSAEGVPQRFDVDRDSVDVVCDWLGERLVGKLGNKLPRMRS
jgi:glucose/arabinose dehydrogenase